MIVWMNHPEHGRMPCYDDLVIQENKKNGWEVMQEIPAIEDARIQLQNVVVNNHDFQTCPHCGKKLGKRPDAHLRFCKGIVHGDNR